MKKNNCNILFKPVVDVSILTANYNQGVFLQDYFESILQSTVLPKEIVIVDDGSTDHSSRVIKKYCHLKSLKYIKLKNNIGFANALNLGIKKANSKYIMRLDPDDFITIDRIEKQYLFLENNKEVDLVGSNVYYFNDRINKTVFKSNFPLLNQEILSSFMRGFHGVVHSSIMIKNDVFKSYHYKQYLFPSEDYDIFLRMSLDGVKMINLSVPLTFYRIHKENSSFFKIKASLIQMNLIRYHSLGRKINPICVWIRIMHLAFYRKALFAKLGLMRYILLFGALLFYPGKIARVII